MHDKTDDQIKTLWRHLGVNPETLLSDLEYYKNYSHTDKAHFDRMIALCKATYFKAQPPAKVVRYKNTLHNPFRPIIQGISLRIAEWLLSRKYLVQSHPMAVLVHDLQYRIQELTNERNSWKTKAIINQVKGI
jgi:hypothetical protein